jgi:methylglutaconyl-CoA hydratase
VSQYTTGHLINLFLQSIIPIFDAMQFSRVIYDVAARKATITLNRPEKRNALDDTLVRELTSAFVAAGKDQNIKVVLLAGAGTAFCAGADLEYLQRLANFDLEENRADSQQLANLFRVIHELRKPVIAVVNGPALAGGCGLATVCDMVVASKEKAQFGYTEVRIGFIPAVVMVFLIRRVGEGKARELVLRGNVFGAEEAQRIGLINIVVPEMDLDATTDQLCAGLINQNSGTAMGLCKEMLAKLPGMSLMDSLDFAANMNAAARMTPDCKQGVGAFLNKEKIKW